MTALAKDRKADELPGKLLSYPVAASSLIYGGAMVGVNASGNAVKASADATLVIPGVCDIQADNSSGAAGDIRVRVRPGIFAMNNSAGGDAIAAGNREQLCYVVDDNTVALTDGGGTRPVAGVIKSIDPITSLVYVELGKPSLYQANPETSPSLATAFRARGVVTANVASLAAFNVNTNTDGITYVAGDVVFLAAQTTAAQNGPYVVGTVATGTAPLTRPDWWAAAAVLKSGVQVRIGGEGTVYKNTTWQAMLAADTFTVDTTDPKLYPLQVSGQSTLVAGTFTISVPVFSTKSNVDLVRTTANTCTATTGGYQPTVAGASGITAGPIGTGSIVIQATVAAGTINNADVSTLNWTVTNQP